jgi:hypothetical protein
MSATPPSTTAQVAESQHQPPLPTARDLTASAVEFTLRNGRQIISEYGSSHGVQFQRILRMVCRILVLGDFRKRTSREAVILTLSFPNIKLFSIIHFVGTGLGMCGLRIRFVASCRSQLVNITLLRIQGLFKARKFLFQIIS